MSGANRVARIVVAPDSFKGTLTARQAASIIADSLASQRPEVEIIQCPVADGGEGTADILSPHLPDNIYLIESAQLIGLNLPGMRSLDVMDRGSAPLGEAILSGLDAGKRDFVIGLGGSATNDCGIGMLMALGLKVFDVEDKQVEPNLASLMSVHSVDLSELDQRLNESRFTVLSDVVSPLCGKKGATAIYGPQKGVRGEDVAAIDEAVARFAELCGGRDLIETAGAGAAGGLGFALMLIGGTIVSGADYVMEVTGFHEKLTDADWVITGEGRSDEQTLHGKLPLKVAEAARDAGVKVALISGSIDKSALPELQKWFDLVVSAQPDGMSVDQAMEQAERFLTEAVKRTVGRLTK